MNMKIPDKAYCGTYTSRSRWRRLKRYAVRNNMTIGEALASIIDALTFDGEISEAKIRMIRKMKKSSLHG